MNKHTVSADRVVNIDETSCRLLPVHQIGWGRRGVKQAQLQGNTKEATTFTVAISMDRGPLDMLMLRRRRPAEWLHEKASVFLPFGTRGTIRVYCCFAPAVLCAPVWTKKKTC